MLNNQTIEVFKQKLEANRKGYKKKYSFFYKPFKRCCDLIEESQNYDFLSSMGYKYTDKEQFDLIAHLVRELFHITQTICVPYVDVIEEMFESNPLAFYRDHQDSKLLLGAKILSVEEVFKAILSYEIDTRDDILSRIAVDSRSLSMLHSSVGKKDIDLFKETLERFGIDITSVGQTIGFVEKIRTDSKSCKGFPDVIDSLSYLHQVSRGSYSMVLPARPQDLKGNITRKNCVEKFIMYHDTARCFFLQLFGALCLFIKGAPDVPTHPVLLQIGKIVSSTDEYKLGVEFYARLAPQSYKDLEEQGGGPTQLDSNEIPPATSKGNILRPLKRPSIFRGQLGAEKAERVYINLMNEGYIITDKNNFLYLFGITSKEPGTGVKRIIWMEKKYKLQVFLHLLYPGRKSKGEDHSPKKSERDAIFCKPNGDSLNLSNTPLQLEKRSSSKKDESRRQSEEIAMNFFKQILGD